MLCAYLFLLLPSPSFSIPLFSPPPHPSFLLLASSSPLRSSCRTWWLPSLWGTFWRRSLTGRRSWPQPTLSSPSGLRSSGPGPTLRASSLDQRTSGLSFPHTPSNLIPSTLTLRLQTGVLYDTILQSYTRNITSLFPFVSLGVQHGCSNIRCQKLSDIFL